MENLQTGSGGSRVLISQGADELDPDSLLEEPDSPGLEVASVTQPLIALTFFPPHTAPFQVGGIFESLNSEPDKLTLEFVGLLSVALDLGLRVLGNDVTALGSLEIRTGEISTPLELHGFQLSLVELVSQSNNRAKVKVVLSRSSI